MATPPARQSRTISRLRLQGSVPLRRFHGYAGAFCHQLECIALVIDGAGSGAGRAGAGITVIVPLEGHAVALLHLAGLDLLFVISLIFIVSASLIIPAAAGLIETPETEPSA